MIQFLYGLHPVQSALKSQKRILEKLYFKADTKNKKTKSIVEEAQNIGVKTIAKDNHFLAQKSGSKIHQGLVLECSDLPIQSLSDLENLADNSRGFVATDCIEDPQNLGAVIRSSAFLNSNGLVLPLNQSAPLSPTVSKSSAGCMESFPVFGVNNLSQTLDKLKKSGFLVVGASKELGAKKYFEIPQQEKVIVVLGNEGSGLRKLTQKKCDEIVFIPGNPDVESLNVSAAASILINYFFNF